MELNSQQSHILFKNKELNLYSVSAINQKTKSLVFQNCYSEEQTWAEIIEAISTQNSLQKLIFKSCNIGNINTQSLAEVAISKLNHIRSLTFYSCKLSPFAMKYICQLQNLLELDLIINNISSNIDQLSALSNLLKLNLRSCFIEENQFSFLLNLSKLESLQMNAPKNIQNFKHLRNLTELTIYLLNYGKEQFEELALLSKLRKLHLIGNFKNQVWFSHICSLVNLRDLLIYQQLRQGQILTSEFRHLQNLTKLEKLHINFGIKKEGIQAISLLPALTELNLSNSSALRNDINDEGCQKLSNLKSLRTLELNNTEIGDTGAGFLSVLPNLQQLSLGNSFKLMTMSEVGFGHLQRIRGLRSLCLYKHEAGDEGMRVISNISSLRELYLGMESGQMESGSYPDFHSCRQFRQILIKLGIKGQGKYLNQEKLENFAQGLARLMQLESFSSSEISTQNQQTFLKIASIAQQLIEQESESQSQKLMLNDSKDI